MKITLNPYDLQSIEQAYKDVLKYKRWLKAKEQELLKRLSMYGATKVSLGFARAIYGPERADIHVRVEIQDKVAKIIAEGEEVAFIEFGAGIRYGNGYLGDKPDDVVGIGEYGKGKGKNPKGWWFTGSDGTGKHTYGNPPAMALYNAYVELGEIMTDIAREVFKS
jgi:hypothetical protein